MLPDLPALVREAPIEELPALLGRLAEAEAVARLRLSTAAVAASTNGRGQEAEDRVLDMPTVAGRLAVSLYTAREMGRRGDLPVIPRGRRVGVLESSLRRFLKERERGGRRA